ncbi:MAG: hypothetical protein M3Q22_17825, partial [Actinomycetota bacterium]|nr:hypothetical protein [Actinomycetota bacterium]
MSFAAVLPRSGGARVIGSATARRGLLDRAGVGRLVGQAVAPTVSRHACAALRQASAHSVMP